MRDILKPSFSLFLVCLVVTFFVALAYNITKNEIIKREVENLNLAMKEVLPEGTNFNEITSNFDKAYGKIKVKGVYESEAGIVFSLLSPGYGGDVTVIIGINNEGFVSGVRLGPNKETPSLGKNAEKPSFTKQFDNLSIDSSIADKVDAISGATITSNAVKNATQMACDRYKEYEGGSK